MSLLTAVYILQFRGFSIHQDLHTGCYVARQNGKCFSLVNDSVLGLCITAPANINPNPELFELRNSQIKTIKPIDTAKDLLTIISHIT